MGICIPIPSHIPLSKYTLVSFCEVKSPQICDALVGEKFHMSTLTVETKGIKKDGLQTLCGINEKPSSRGAELLYKVTEPDSGNTRPETLISDFLSVSAPHFLPPFYDC